MDINFFEPIDELVEKIDSSYAGCVQVQNISGSILQIAEGCYLRTYAFALVSEENNNLEKFIKTRKVKVHPLKFSKTKKKKTTKQEPKEEDNVSKIGQSIDIDELAAMFTMDKSKFQVEKNATE
jgi:hypothetical protein